MYDMAERRRTQNELAAAADQGLKRPRPAGQRSIGRILVAEDHPVNQRVATAMLEHLGYHVDVVADGAEAVKAATFRPYQAILMDCQIPVLDGYQATSEIRRLQGASRRIPIIAVTGSGEKSNQPRCMAAGMDDYLTKPLSLKALAGVLARWVPKGTGTTIADDQTDGTPALDLGPNDGADPARPALDAQIVGRLQRLGTAAGEDLMGQLAVLFLADAEARIVALREALAGDDRQAVVFSAHALNGASANLGATDLARLCAAFETDGGTGDPRGKGTLEAVETELGRVRTALGLLASTPGT
jgi:two-component system, sensor histidine kinase and response regulator